MQRFQDTFLQQTRKRSFITAFSACMTAVLKLFSKNYKSDESVSWCLTIDQREIRVVYD